MSTFKIIAWNVNGIRAFVKKKDLQKYLDEHKPHIFCMSETKLSCPDLLERKKLKELIKGYKFRYFSTCTRKKGYSGTSIWCKKEPISVSYGLGKEEHDKEGRVITLEFDKFFITHVYTPNSGQGLVRLKYRVNEWDVEYRKFIKKLQKKKPVIICGDLNVAHKEIDIHSPKTNLKSAGFTIQERNSFDKLLNENKLIDTFRYLHPDKKDFYSYWTYFRQARPNNKGWRIDYFLVSDSIKKNVKKSTIHTDQMGSDHAPVFLKIKF
tara:strand:+ start:23 stop:820 length:798 start_codon:yes stop_codon:yes gene_type:complete